MSDGKEENLLSPQDEEKALLDPFAQMFQFYDAFSKSWAEAMSGTVASKSFADAMARQMDAGLDAVTLFRSQMSDWFEQSMQQMSLPTRRDLNALAERLTNLEIAVDDLDAKLDEALRLLKAKPSA